MLLPNKLLKRPRPHPLCQRSLPLSPLRSSSYRRCIKQTHRQPRFFLYPLDIVILSERGALAAESKDLRLLCCCVFSFATTSQALHLDRSSVVFQRYVR